MDKLIKLPSGAIINPKWVRIICKNVIEFSDGTQCKINEEDYEFVAKGLEQLNSAIDDIKDLLTGGSK